MDRKRNVKNMEREIYYSKDGAKVMIVAPITELEQITGIMDRSKYKYDYMLVIGNGFDLNLGLPTTYSNFVESCIFKRMYVKRQMEKRTKGNAQPSLIDFLYAKKLYERWYDIEFALLEYVSRKPDGSFVNNVEEDKKDYDLVCKTMIEYLSSLFKTGNDLKQADEMRNTASAQLLKRFSSDRNVVYSFNYTPIDSILGIVFDKSLKTVKVHGEVKEDAVFKGIINESDIILGVETNDIESIAPGYSFLLKSNRPAYKSSNIAFDLMNTRNIIIFGHSLNQQDFGYFEEYFKMLETNTELERTLTIITRDCR